MTIRDAIFERVYTYKLNDGAVVGHFICVGLFRYFVIPLFRYSAIPVIPLFRYPLFRYSAIPYSVF